jgi:sirohydrochlorin cobaltochelatase
MFKAFPATAENSRPGLLMVGHGTRNESGLAEFQALARQVAELGSAFDLESCFLELAQPDIPTGVRRLLDCGVQRLVVAPVLLFAAGHAKRDIPMAVSEALDQSEKNSTIDITHAKPFECHEKILELSAIRYHESVANRAPIDPAETLLILVGRGSSYPEALAEMRRFTALRAERTPVARAETCFVAIAKPSLPETLAWAADTSFRRIVVQPHVLFTGEVLAEVEKAVAALSAQQPDRQWIATSHLGPSPLVAEALLDLVRSGS